MSITSMNARMGMAEKLDIPQLTKAVQDGTVPSFIGIPLIQQKMQEAQQAKALATPKAPPIAQQVLQQAQAMQGVQALPTNMPEEYAQGGILHYAEGDLVDDDDYEEMMYDDQISEAQKQIEQIRNQMMEQQGSRMAEMGSASPSYGGIDYAEAPNPQVEYQRTPTTEVAKISKGKPDNFESLALARGKAHGVDEHLVKHVMHKETGGLKDRANAVSPAGAIGVMQLMPNTAKDLGVKNPYDPEQNIEGGVKYLAQLQRKYQDPKLAAIAYNWGPGNTDKWLASGADISRLPRETRGYIQNLAEGGIVGLAGGGMDGVRINPNQNFSIPPVDDLEKQKALLERMRRIEQAKAAFADMPKVTPTPAATPAAGGSALGAGAVLSGIPLLGGMFSYGAANQLSNQSPDQLEQLEGFGADPSGTSFGAAIMRQAKMNEAKKAEPSAPAPAPAKPANDQARLAQIYADQRALGNTSLGKDKPLGPIDINFGPDQYMPQEEKKAEEAPTVDTSANEINEIKNLLKQRGEGLSKQKDIDNYMSLLSAGLGMMGGTSPYAAANIGQGAQAGISHALQAQRGRAADENALLSGRLGLYKYQQAADTNKLNRDFLNKYRTESLEEAKAKNRAEQGLKSQALEERKREQFLKIMQNEENIQKSFALANSKTAMTAEAQAAAQAAAMAKLYATNPRFREAHKGYFGYYPAPLESDKSVRKFDNSFGKKD